MLGCQPGAADDDPGPDAELASFAQDLSNVGGEKSGAEGQPIEPWPTSSVSYAFDGMHPDLDEPTFRSEVRAALDEWTWATEGRRTFHEIADPHDAQIVLGFRAADHAGAGNCKDSFSRGLLTIAHAYTFESTCLAGTIHLNQDLTWVMDGSNRKGTYDVRYAVLHEVGHILGLSHVNEPGHIMYANYVGVVRKLTQEESQAVIAVLDGK
ncbi:MAG: matrixin family metalloprotease [Polyangiaceae bacterium]